MPEGKKCGCGCSGCFMFILYTVIILIAGMFLGELSANKWDANIAKDKVIEKSKNIGKKAYDVAKEKISGATTKEEKDSEPEANKTPPIPNTKDWKGMGDEALQKALDTLKNASKATGADKATLEAAAKTKLSYALENFQKAEQIDNGNQIILEKIAEISKLQEQLSK